MSRMTQRKKSDTPTPVTPAPDAGYELSADNLEAGVLGPRAGYAIREWLKYEPTRREVEGNGPLKYVKSWVHGHGLGVGYRRLMQVGNGSGMAAFGFFHKLLELAADEPRAVRNGIIHLQGAPADIGDIAFLLDIAEMDAQAWMNILLEVGWVIIDDGTTARRRDGDGPRGSGSDNGPREPSDKEPREPSAKGRREPSANGTEQEHNGTEHNGTEQEETGVSGGTADSGSIPWHAGVADACLLELMDELKVASPAENDRTTRARQCRADRTTLERIIRAVVIDPTKGKARGQANVLLELARESQHKRPEQRMRSFVAEAKERFSVVRELWK